MKGRDTIRDTLSGTRHSVDATPGTRSDSRAGHLDAHKSSWRHRFNNLIVFCFPKAKNVCYITNLWFVQLCRRLSEHTFLVLGSHWNWKYRVYSGKVVKPYKSIKLHNKHKISRNKYKIQRISNKQHRVIRAHICLILLFLMFSSVFMFFILFLWCPYSFYAYAF